VRLRLAFVALTTAVAAAGLVEARQTEPEAATALPSAPIPYNQLNRPRPAAPRLKPAITEDTPAIPEKPPEPLKRARAPTAVLQALDKVTAQNIRFEAQVGKPVRYKNLVFTVRACETAAPDELAPEAAAYIIIDSAPRQRQGASPLPGRQLFRGWMYASTPGVNPLQHPVYDAWLIACKTAAPSPANP